MSQELIRHPCAGFPPLSGLACDQAGSRVRVGRPGQAVGYITFLCATHQEAAQRAGRTISPAPRGGLA
jgi:hypothetical protein